MKGIKKVIALGTMVLTMGAASGAAFAATSYNSPAEAAAALTGKTKASIISERVQSGNTYGKIASEAGVLNEFKSEMLEIRKNKLNTRVQNQTMTQEQADAIIKSIEANQADCDGTHTARIGNAMAAQFGAGSAMGKGNGEAQGLAAGARDGKGKGIGQGLAGGPADGKGKGGNGMGLRNGNFIK
jgi:hypothetical protein